MKPVADWRVVLDTNVWLSAALAPAGTPAQVVRAVLLHGVPVFSAATFAELEQRIWKPKFDRYLSLERRRAILRDAKASAHWVDIAPALAAQTFCRDPDDDAFVRTALAAPTPWLVTGDADLLHMQPVPESLHILSPQQALQEQAFGFR